MIYTSYFAKMKDLPDNIVPISIAGKSPDWYNGLEYKVLAPKYDFFMKWKANHNNDYYIKCYNEQVLAPLDLNIVINDFESVGENVALLCYEKPGDFCHRHLVSKWLIEHGILCEEYDFNKRTP